MRFSLGFLLFLCFVCGVVFLVLTPYLKNYFRHQGLSVPTRFDLSTGKNVIWTARLGSVAWGRPVVAHNKLWIGTNNTAGYLPQFPATVDLGALICFRSTDGEFLWQHSSEKLATGRLNDWPLQGVTSTPTVEGERLWYVTNRAEVVCLDIEGFYDEEDDGIPDRRPNRPFEIRTADRVWQYDMIGELGVNPHNASCSGVAVSPEAVFVVTGNGVDESHLTIPNPEAPSFLALNKHDGTLLWSDRSPGSNLLHGQWGTPVYAVLAGTPQVIFPGGDGWLYSFDPAGDGHGEGKLLWKFDCNLKTSKWLLGGKGDRHNLLAPVTVAGGLVYVAMGRDPELGEGTGRVWCIDPSKRGDVSSELVFAGSNLDLPVPHRRVQACDSTAGEVAVPNPNSAEVWRYERQDLDGDGEIAFEEEMHLAVSPVVIRDDLAWVCDHSGILHCLNAKTGRLHWTHDFWAASWSTPLVSDRNVYVTDEDGDVAVFAISSDPQVAKPAGKPIAESYLPSVTRSSPVIIDNVLYLVGDSTILAIGDQK